MRPVLAADALSWTFVPNVAAGLSASALVYRRWSQDAGASATASPGVV